VYIFCGLGLVACRWRQLSSNVRPHSLSVVAASIAANRRRLQRGFSSSSSWRTRLALRRLHRSLPSSVCGSISRTSAATNPGSGTYLSAHVRWHSRDLPWRSQAVRGSRRWSRHRQRGWPPDSTGAASSLRSRDHGSRLVGLQRTAPPRSARPGRLPQTCGVPQDRVLVLLSWVGLWQHQDQCPSTCAPRCGLTPRSTPDPLRQAL
jgi:hypothetical protein